jgi:uncharacterized membrane protein YdjX (TVP38/TMEM64 family)
MGRVEPSAHPREPHPERRIALIRLAAFGALLAVVLAVGSATGSIPGAGEVREWGEDLGPAAPIAFVPLFVALNFVVTWPLLAGAAGLIFGTAAGVPLALAGVTAASLVQMAVSRYLVGDAAGRMLPARVQGLERFLERNGWVAVMESRIVPLLPFGVVNFAAGVTRLPFRHMALGTVIGALPKVWAYVALGGSLSDLGAPEAKIAIALLVVLAIAGGVVVRRQLRAEGAA